MKWFQHFSTAHIDFALREIIEEFDGEGYGLYWLCVELVAQQGKNHRIKGSKGWKKQLSLILHLDTKRAETILNKLADSNLINKLALNKGDLYIPKMRRYSDDYTDRVAKSRRVSEQSSKKSPRRDNTTLHNTRREESVSSSKKLKPFYKGDEMRKDSRGKFWVLPKDGGKWLEFGGEEKEIQWK